MNVVGKLLGADMTYQARSIKRLRAFLLRQTEDKWKRNGDAALGFVLKVVDLAVGWLSKAVRVGFS